MTSPLPKKVLSPFSEESKLSDSPKQNQLLQSRCAELTRHRYGIGRDDLPMSTSGRAKNASWRLQATGRNRRLIFDIDSLSGSHKASKPIIKIDSPLRNPFGSLHFQVTEATEDTLLLGLMGPLSINNRDAVSHDPKGPSKPNVLAKTLPNRPGSAE
jgi:hypothetical protein